MTDDEVEAILGDPTSSWAAWVGRWDCDEGSIGIEFQAVPKAGQEHDPRPEIEQTVFDKEHRSSVAVPASGLARRLAGTAAAAGLHLLSLQLREPYTPPSA